MDKTKLFLFITSTGILFIISLIFSIDKLQKQKTLTAAITTLTQQGTIQQATAGRKVTESDHRKGNKNANITLIEYSDFQCTSCQTIQPTIDKIMQTYGKNILFVTRNSPLPQHPNEIQEAEAAECAGELGGDTAYWQYSKKIFDNSTAVTDGIQISFDKLVPFAKDLGLDEKKFSDCLESGKFLTKINADKEDGAKAGVSQLPAILIIDKKNRTQLIVGSQPYEVYKLVLDMDVLQ